MAEKRKDNRGIQLKTGETQLANGKYRYRYFDDTGKAHEVTSWTLRKEDPTPDGRKPGLSLRELEAEIKKQLEQGVRAWDASITVAELCKRYIEEKGSPAARRTLAQRAKCRYNRSVMRVPGGAPGRFGRNILPRLIILNTGIFCGAVFRKS